MKKGTDYSPEHDAKARAELFAVLTESFTMEVWRTYTFDTAGLLDLVLRDAGVHQPYSVVK